MQSQKLTQEEIDFYKKLNTPEKIQEYLDGLDYNHCIPEYTFKSPRYVLKNKNAHCLEGAFFAAAVRRVNGYEPLILSITGQNNDDHIVALFRYKTYWGTIGQSEYEPLKWRDPIYKTIREVVMSFFPVYLLENQITMTGHSNPINISCFDNLNWMTTKKDLHKIGDYLGYVEHKNIIPTKVKLRLATDKMTATINFSKKSI